MPKRGQTGIKDPKTQQYRQMLENTDVLCTSMVYNELYDKLRKDRRLDRFIAVVQYCSIQGYNKKQTVEETPAPVTEKECPYCKSTININATRCPHCTSELE